jgi:hypothetical protein
MRTYLPIQKLAYNRTSGLWMGMIVLTFIWCTATKGQAAPSDTTFKYQWGFAVQPAYYFPSKSHHFVFPWVEWKGAFGGTFRFFYQQSLSDVIVFETGLGLEALPYQIQLDRRVTIPHIAGEIPVKWNRYSYEFSCLQIPFGLNFSKFSGKNHCLNLGIGLQPKLMRSIITNKNITVIDSLGKVTEVFDAILYPEGEFRPMVKTQLAAYLKGGIHFRDKAKKRQFYFNAYLQFSPWPIASGLYHAQDGGVTNFGWMKIRQNNIGIEMGLGFNRGLKAPRYDMKSDPNLKR